MSAEVVILSKGPDDLDEAVKAIIEVGKATNIWLFMGQMGAGKTTLIKAICGTLQVLDEVNSPTFSIVNEYLTVTDDTLYHFDFYRLENEEEAYNIGIEEYFYSGNTCMLEWPERVEGLLPDNFLRIDITENTDQSRTIKLTMYG
ncbi:MAG: tRNA (adenosine(37)-N6)-threonylcarbamoyltransferase complex ATPase subunit type 1 TsaE [Roseivirga sp.]|nr:tRNA (adenosine(37)-N6)-threonylcarbamoyltransferase complex ATPase subunit type 1 TsaE [Roseivirga sp.]